MLDVRLITQTIILVKTNEHLNNTNENGKKMVLDLEKY